MIPSFFMISVSFVVYWINLYANSVHANHVNYNKKNIDGENQAYNHLPTRTPREPFYHNFMVLIIISGIYIDALVLNIFLAVQLMIHIFEMCICPCV